MTMSFDILSECIFEKRNIRISYMSSAQVYPKEIKDFISERWEKTTNSSKKIFDGNLFNLNSYQIKNNMLELNVSDITYREFYSIRDESFTKRFGNRFTSNPLSVGAIIETDDDMILLGKRANDLDYAPGHYGTLAGVMDRNIDCTDKMPDPFKTLLRELKEEKSVLEDEILEMKCIGLVRNTTFKQTYLPFSVRLKIDSQTLLKKPMIEKEFTSFITIPNRKESVQSFLDEHAGNVSGTCLANLQTWAKTVKRWAQLKL